MPPRRSSFGVCEVCGTRCGKAAMTAHLRKCLGQAGDADDSSALSFGRRLSTPTTFWLDCAAPAGRNWTRWTDFSGERGFECCGHMSAFTNGRSSGSSMTTPIATAFGRSGGRLEYQDDFGSTTAFVLSLSGPVAAQTSRSVLARRSQRGTHLAMRRVWASSDGHLLAVSERGRRFHLPRAYSRSPVWRRDDASGRELTSDGDLRLCRRGVAFSRQEVNPFRP